MLSSDLVRCVLDSAPDALIILNSAGDIVFANNQVKTLFGYEAAELIGQKVEILLPERFRTHHVGHRVGYIRNPRVRPMGSGFDLFARRHDGSEFPVEISLSPAEDEEKTLTVAACDNRLRTASKPINPDELLSLVRELSAACGTNG